MQAKRSRYGRLSRDRKGVHMGLRPINCNEKPPISQRPPPWIRSAMARNRLEADWVPRRSQSRCPSRPAAYRHEHPDGHSSFRRTRRRRCEEASGQRPARVPLACRRPPRPLHRRGERYTPHPRRKRLQRRLPLKRGLLRLRRLQSKKMPLTKAFGPPVFVT